MLKNRIDEDVALSQEKRSKCLEQCSLDDAAIIMRKLTEDIDISFDTGTQEAQDFVRRREEKSWPSEHSAMPWHGTKHRSLLKATHQLGSNNTTARMKVSKLATMAVSSLTPSTTVEPLNNFLLLWNDH